jgi:hypothetical protein
VAVFSADVGGLLPQAASTTLLTAVPAAVSRKRRREKEAMVGNSMFWVVLSRAAGRILSS